MFKRVLQFVIINLLFTPLVFVSANTTTISYQYDAQGNRIGYTTPASNVISPTKLYNVDTVTGKKTKPVFAGDTLVATVETTGTSSIPYYVHGDNIGSSSVISDSTGTKIETLDYFPFGVMRLDEKTGTFNERDKYIGQEYDDTTSLNYLNARYYNAKIGKFISEDAVASTAPEKLLTNPQQLNLYSYSINNPITGSDPSGLLTVVIPGTFYNSVDWSDKGGKANFLSSVQNTFKDTMIVENNTSVWSGQDNDSARQSAATAIAQQINNYHFADGEKLNIVGHSHGGNVANLVTGEINHKVDNLVTLGTPVISGYSADRENVKNQVNVYSWLDPVQVLGGNQLSLTGIAGTVIGGLLTSPFGLNLTGAMGGFMEGNALGWGQFGYGSRTISGANNVDVTWQTGFLLTKVHGNLASSSTWSKVDNLLNKK